jgi:uncharacterized membrane protein YdjX (TVP38/TMEM64 family)
LLHHWLGLIAQGRDAGMIGFWLIVFVSFVPILPIPVIAAAVGAVSNVWIAILVTWGAATVAAIAKFLLERWLLYDPATRLLKRMRGWEKIVAFVGKNGFFAVLLTRAIPFIPSSVINTAGALTGVGIWTFIWATALGKLPTMVVFTVAGNQLRHHLWLGIILLIAYLTLILAASWFVKRRLKLSGK